MSTVLQPILVPVNGAPDIVLSTDPNSPDELFVFLGMALLEKVPHMREHPAFKMLLARLHNGGVSGQRLTDLFGVARSTLRRWGRALKSGDLDRIRDAFSGQGAARKVTPEIERYVRDRFRDLYGQCRDYSRMIQAEVERYFKTPLSPERLRWIFREEREKLGAIPENDANGTAGNGADPATEDPAGEGGGSNNCEKVAENAAIGSFLQASRNYSLQSMPCSDRPVPEKPTLCHHAGVLLMSHWIDTLTAEWTVRPDLVRQWVGQVLLGAVNHEQSKRLSFSSLEWLIGPAIRSLNHQRRLLGELASVEHIGAMFNRWLQENDFGYMNRHVGINELTSRSHESYASIGKSLDDRQVLSREYKALRREKTHAESALKQLLLKREKQHEAHARQCKRERVEMRKLNRQIKKLSDAHDEAKKERELRKRRRTQERLVAKHKTSKNQRAERKVKLGRLIDDQRQKVRDADERMGESVRDESRLQALTEEQYVRLDTRRKAFMDAIRISCRNIFCKLAMEFRPLYDNYRDDHFIVRELTHSSGIIHKRDGIAHVLLMPTMQFQPATRDIVQAFLAQISQRINDHFDGRSMPIHIQLLDENSNDLDIDQHGLSWVSSLS